MLSVIADGSNEGNLEGLGELNSRYVEIVEAQFDTTGQTGNLLQGDMSRSMPSSFPQAALTPDSISFAPGADLSNGLGDLGMNFNINSGPLGDTLSSIVQSIMQLPGMGLLSQIFQFLGSLFTSLVQALDPAMIAREAQGALDLKKLMMQG